MNSVRLDKPIATGIWSEPRLSISIVFDPDGDDGIYEIPTDPPGPGHAQTTVTAFCDCDNNSATTMTTKPMRQQACLLDSA